LGIFVAPRLSARTTMSAVQTPTETARVKRGTLVVAVNATGSVVAQDEIALGFTSGGRLAQALVKENPAVQAGQPLARLDTADLELQLAQAEATLAQVRAGARTEDIAAAEAALRSAQANYAKLAAPPRAEELTMAKADLDKAAACSCQSPSARAKSVYAKPSARVEPIFCFSFCSKPSC
ncbi:MAG: biotin/lipoyl-binding protein, partial [Anaerolineales bacterium]|nr:biotin/lipoyl-binding protein [Anaerolineales bacterium]